MTYIELLSTSRVRGKVVAHLARNRNKGIRPLTLAKEINEDKGAVGHLLREFVRSGFAVLRRDGQSSFYQINPSCPIIDELETIAKEVR